VNKAVRCDYCATAVRANPGAVAFATCRTCGSTATICAKCCKDNCIDVHALDPKVDLCPNCAEETGAFTTLA
jgi:hypothetical protein